MSEELPPGWVAAPLKNVVTFNPKHDRLASRDTVVSFIPMAAVSDETGSIIGGMQRPLAEVWKGYAHFAEGDVLFAKITPCMENGKAAIARGLVNGLGCGSTEFFVLRPSSAILSEYLWHFIRQHSFREEAKQAMSGAVGQQRVPTSFLQEYPIPLPPLAEQRRIVARIEALFERTRRARADLLRIAPLSERYRLAVLRAALRGELTADWRSRVGALEPAERLVARTPTPSQPRGGREATDEVIPGVAALSVNHPRTEAPPGWAWVPLLRLARQESGHTPSRSVAAHWNGDIPWIGIRDAGAHHGGVIQDTAQHVTQAGLDNSSARLLPAQTVCLSRTASVGYVVVMGRPMATSQDFVTWTCSSALLPDFLKYALLAEGDDIRRFGKGSTHTTIYFPEIRALHICLPPLAEQYEIVRLLDQALPAVGKAEHDGKRAVILLGHLERSVLARAFRGELVPQDQNDEPANALLARLRADASAPVRRGRPGRVA